MPPKRKKILYVTPGLRQGGAERQLMELIRRLPDRFEPVLCLFEDGDMHYREYLAPGEPRHVLGARRMHRAGLLALAKIIREEKPDILHCFRDRANLWTRLAVWLHKVPVKNIVTSVRNRAIDPLNLLTEKYFASFTRKVLTNSEGVRKELVRLARVPSEMIQIIPNFVDQEKFHAPDPDERRRARAKYGLSDNELALVLPGRISIQKHQLGLMLALRWIRAQGRLPPPVRILLAGRARDRLYSWAVHQVARRSGFAGQIQWLGAVSDMLTLYHAADGVLMPSLYEGMPNAVIEAQICGLPVVVSAAANADGLVLAGKTGLQIPEGPYDQLAETLARFIELPTENRRAMGQAGRERLLTLLNPERLIGQFTQLYDQILDER